MKHSFRTFREASQFASNYSRENRCETKLVREGDAWVVASEVGSTDGLQVAASPNRTGWLPEAEWRAKIERERQQRVEENANIAAKKAAENLEARLQADRIYLEKRHNEYLFEIEQERIAQEFAARVREKEAKEWPDKMRNQEIEKEKYVSKKPEILKKARAHTLTFEQLTLVIDNYLLYDFSTPEIEELRRCQNELLPRSNSAPELKVCSKCYLIVANCTCKKTH